MKIFLKMLCALWVAGGVSASAQVVFSEIHYHPVEEPAFAADGTPAIDLTEDVHEFLELQNAGATAVDLSGWTVSGGIDFTIPGGTTLAAGSFVVIAKDPARLATVYGLVPASILGPYTGNLNNHGDDLRLRDPGGSTRDQVNYSSSFPWPNSADALGANQRFLGFDPHAYQYKGRSLQRVSATWSGNDPANWLASPLSPGPTPGAPQAVTRATPKPVVVGLRAVQVSDGAAIPRAGEAVRITATFSATDSLSGVQLEYFQDDVNSTTESRQALAMTASGGGVFSATVPGFPDRSIIRYRVRANRGAGVEVVAPRADDAQIAPIGSGGAREAWYGYFVTPVRGVTGPAYDVFVSTSVLATMGTNIQQFPRRVTTADENGLPREVPYVGPTQPQWNGTQPAVFCAEGQVWDIHARYHGGYNQRSVSRDSYKFHFPDFQPFHGVTSIFETGHDWKTMEGQGIFSAAGFPQTATRTVNLFMNNRAVLVRLEHGEANGELLDSFHQRQHRLDPAAPKEESGELYKAIGNIDNSGNNTEGPYTRADFAAIAANASWTSLQRYEWTYSLQNHAWKGSLPLKSLVESLWTARGDTPLSPGLNVAATRAWCEANLDVDATLTSLALINWMGAWDDVCHNQFFWRRANGKWTRLSWDFDALMEPVRVNQSIFVGGTGEQDPFFGPNWFKDTILKCYRAEFRQRLWELNNSLLDPDNLNALGFTNAAAFAVNRRGPVNTKINAELNLGAYAKPDRPVHVSPTPGGVVTAATATLTASAFTHSGGGTHAKTKWEIRSATGDYVDPVFVLTTTTQKTSLVVPYDQLVYGQTYFWRVTYYDQLGHPSVLSTETSFTWGSGAPAAGTLVLHEIMAANQGAVENAGAFPDYIELRNNGGGAVALDGMTLTDDPLVPRKYAFPVGTTIPPNGFLVVWCDRDDARPGLHSGFKLNASGQTVLLLNDGGLVDSVTFGPQAANYPIGRTSGTGGWVLVAPSPGAANSVAQIGPSTGLRINEWMADPRHGTDWFELYNPGVLPVSIGGLHLTDNFSAPLNTTIPALSFMGPGGFTEFAADDSSSGGNHCHFKLSAGGDSIFLLGADGVTVVDGITFGRQQTNISQGRVPDGGSAIASFPLTSSPGRSNWLPSPVVINEALTNSTVPFEDAIELYNTSNVAVDLGGWWLSDDRTQLRKYQIPSGTIVSAGGYLVLYENEFGSSFALSSFGDEIVLSQEADGVLTGVRAQVSFGAAADGVAFGRVPLSGAPDEFWPLTAHTFGADAPADVAAFRTGTGLANAAPLTGPIIINEIQYQPPDLAGADNTWDEFIELHNISAQAVDMAGWVVRGDVDFAFAAGTSVASGAYILLVGFDPSNTATLAAFRATYGLDSSTVILGPYTPKLDNDGARIELARPGETTNGVKPLLLVDKVDYRDFAPWPASKGQSLQRQGRYVIGNDPANWVVGVPAPGAINHGQLPFNPGGTTGTIAFAESSSNIAENGGTAAVTVTRYGELVGTVGVHYATSDGSAVSGMDYTATTGTVTFTGLETTKTIAIPILNDNAPEAVKSFTLALSAPTGGAILSSPSIHTVSIADNDAPSGGHAAVLQFATTTSSVAENVAGGGHLVSIVRTGNTNGVVSVVVSQDSSDPSLPPATAGQDFADVFPIHVTFAAGEMEKSVLISLIDDALGETNERLSLVLSTPDGGAEIGPLARHDVIITSDDALPGLPPQRAGYTGLINETLVRPGYGAISFITTGHGLVTGRLFADGVTYPFMGRFNSSGGFHCVIRSRSGAQVTNYQLVIQMQADGDRFDGDFAGSLILGERNASGTVAVPVVGAGQYTALLRENAEPVGSLSFSIARTGAVRLIGMMGDGTAVSGATALSQTGRLPLAIGLYAAQKGYLLGAGQLASDGNPRKCIGEMAWSKPAPAKPEGVYPNGFPVKYLDLSGAAFTPPVRGARLLPAISAAQMDLSEGDLAPLPPSTAITISAQNRFLVPASPRKVTLAVAPTTGVVTGSFRHTDGNMRRLRGVVVQQDAAEGPGLIEGTFPGTTVPGTIRISPR